jgi:hypothetical protein
VPIVLALLVSVHKADAFSFKEFFSSIFGSHKVEETQSAASAKATSTDTSKDDTMYSIPKMAETPPVVKPPASDTSTTTDAVKPVKTIPVKPTKPKQIASCNAYNYITQWGSPGSANGQFHGLQGVAVDSLNNVYTIESANRVQKFTSNGTYITQWGSWGFGNGAFHQPLDVATDSSNNVYVADGNNFIIQKFTSNGVFLSQFGQFGPNNNLNLYTGMSANKSSGDIYSAYPDTNNSLNRSEIVRFDANGQYIFQWGNTGQPNSAYYYKLGTDSSSGNVYVANYMNNKVEKYTFDGQYISQWGTIGSGNGQFDAPSAVAVDSSGDVYVSEFGNHRIQKFTSNGTYITQWGTQGTGNGQLSSPNGVAIDSLGNVYVADTGNDRIQKFGCAIVQTPSITVTSPNGGETYQAGQQINITWNSQNISSSAALQITLEAPFPGGGTFDLSPLLVGGGPVLNSGSATFTLPVQGFGAPNQWFQMQYGTYYKVKIHQVTSPNGIFAEDLSDNLFTITAPSNPSSLCAINSFTVPASTTLASGASVAVSWSSNCNNVMLEANSGSYTLRYEGGPSGTHTFTAGAGGSFSTKDNSIDITMIAGNASDTISQTKSVPIVDIASPASNQCQFSSLTATPNPLPTGSNQTTLSWVAPAGCIVYVESWTPSANGLSTAHIFKPGTYYFNATDSVNVTLSKSSTYYLSAQAGFQSAGSNTTVLSAKTIDVKVQNSLAICNPLDPPSIQLINPLSGNYHNGDHITINWVSCNIPASTLLQISYGGMAGGPQGFFALGPTLTPNDGIETYLLPPPPLLTPLPAGPYSIGICIDGGGPGNCIGNMSNPGFFTMLP